MRKIKDLLECHKKHCGGEKRLETSLPHATDSLYALSLFKLSGVSLSRRELLSRLRTTF
jgi:hypothetical protein